jgi:hypothetical protein
MVSVGRGIKESVIVPVKEINGVRGLKFSKPPVINGGFRVRDIKCLQGRVCRRDNLTNTEAVQEAVRITNYEAALIVSKTSILL